MKPDEISCTVLPGGIGLIVLQRPQMLNALSQHMCEEIDAHLQKWQTDDNIFAVIIRGEGERAFCAGGDIRYIYETARDNPEKGLEFFEIEYQMNRRLFHFPKPYIALLHSVTMGGGLGVSIHGSHRVAAESLVLAMPETGIGFYPDVGGSYFLPRLQGKSGWYLGLTGAHINAHDAYYLGLVDFIIDKSDFDDVCRELCQTNLSVDAHHHVSDVLKRWQMPVDLSHLAEHQNEIDHCFAGETIQKIQEQLQNSQSPWCHEQSKILQKKSPASLQMTCAQLAQGAQMDFDQCMDMELKLTAECLKSHDFFEGIRAAIIDKDRLPRWD